jgi:hypothetical protein
LIGRGGIDSGLGVRVYGIGGSIGGGGVGVVASNLEVIAGVIWHGSTSL